MKKLIAGMLSASAVFSAGFSAFAADYDVKDVYYGTTDTVMTSTSGYKTVMITKEAELDGTAVTATNNSNLVYINQNSASGFDDTVGFLMKSNPETGYYKAVFGNEAGQSTSVYFVVGEAEVDPDDAIADETFEAEPYGVDKDTGVTYYKKGFTKTVAISDFNNYKSIKIVSSDGSEYLGAMAIDFESAEKWNDWKKFNVSGEGDIVVGLQVYGIPKEDKDLKVYFSDAEVNEKSE